MILCFEQLLMSTIQFHLYNYKRLNVNVNLFGILLPKFPSYIKYIIEKQKYICSIQFIIHTSEMHKKVDIVLTDMYYIQYNSCDLQQLCCIFFRFQRKGSKNNFF